MKHYRPRVIAVWLFTFALPLFCQADDLFSSPEQKAAFDKALAARNSGEAFIDIILYSGPQKEINFNDITHAAIVFTLSVIAQTDHPASSVEHPDTVIPSTSSGRPLSEQKNLPSNRQSSIVNHQSSIINRQSSIINQPSPPAGVTSP